MSWPGGPWRPAGCPGPARGPAPADGPVDRDSLQRRPGPGSLGGHTDLAALDPEAGRRLAGDSAVTRVLVTHHPTHHHHPDPGGHPDPGHHHDHHHPDRDGSDGGLATRLQTAAARLPPILGGAPSQPWTWAGPPGSSTPRQRIALTVRDGGGGFPGCDRPLAWCDAHHLGHWLDGGPTDLANLVLLCRAHHRAVHDGGWQLARGPDGHLAATPPHRPAGDNPPPPDRREERHPPIKAGVAARRRLRSGDKDRLRLAH